MAFETMQATFYKLTSLTIISNDYSTIAPPFSLASFTFFPTKIRQLMSYRLGLLKFNAEAILESMDNGIIVCQLELLKVRIIIIHDPHKALKQKRSKATALECFTYNSGQGYTEQRVNSGVVKKTEVIKDFHLH